MTPWIPVAIKSFIRKTDQVKEFKEKFNNPLPISE